MHGHRTVEIPDIVRQLLCMIPRNDQEFQAANVDVPRDRP